MIKVGFLLNIGFAGLVGCETWEVLEFADFDSLDDLDCSGRVAKDVILEYGQDGAEWWAEYYGYYKADDGCFYNENGDEVTPEVTAYLLTTAEEEEAFTAGLDEGIGEIIS